MTEVGCLLVGRPLCYLWLELPAFNLLLFYLLRRQEKMSRSLSEGESLPSYTVTVRP
jgi:hypothetical protein